jgi:hypothetical protein
MLAKHPASTKRVLKPEGCASYTNRPFDRSAAT